jgi:hypothetical protein
MVPAVPFKVQFAEDFLDAGEDECAAVTVRDEDVSPYF